MGPMRFMWPAYWLAYCTSKCSKRSAWLLNGADGPCFPVQPRSKKSDGDGGFLREFESLQGGRVAVAESAKGKLSIAPTPSTAARKKSKAILPAAGFEEGAAKMMQGFFAGGCSQPTRARIWGEIKGAPWGDETESGTLFDGMACDEMADFELFVGPTQSIEAFLNQGAKRIHGSWQDLASSDDSDYDCVVLAIWDDGGPWAAAGLFRMQQADGERRDDTGNMGWDLRQMCKEHHPKVIPLGDSPGQYGCIEDLVQQISGLDGAPAEAVRAAALFMGESELTRRWEEGPDSGDKDFCPDLEGAICEIFALRESRVLAQSALAVRSRSPRKSI